VFDGIGLGQISEIFRPSVTCTRQIGGAGYSSSHMCHAAKLTTAIVGMMESKDVDDVGEQSYSHSGDFVERLERDNPLYSVQLESFILSSIECVHFRCPGISTGRYMKLRSASERQVTCTALPQATHPKYAHLLLPPRPETLPRRPIITDSSIDDAGLERRPLSGRHGHRRLSSTAALSRRAEQQGCLAVAFKSDLPQRP